MKKGNRIRFKVANYTATHQRIEATGEVAEGTVIRREGDGLVVRVIGYELPFYVMPDDILEERNK